MSERFSSKPNQTEPDLYSGARLRSWIDRSWTDREIGVSSYQGPQNERLLDVCVLQVAD